MVEFWKADTAMSYPVTVEGFKVQCPRCGAYALGTTKEFHWDGGHGLDWTCPTCGGDNNVKIMQILKTRRPIPIDYDEKDLMKRRERFATKAKG